MMRKLAAAIIAASLIGGPALAQTPGSIGAPNTPATIIQPAAKADTVKTTGSKVTETKKHVAKIRHHRKHFAHVKHVKDVKHAKHMKRPAKIKTVG